jgi:transcriptional antiterminator NusG
MKDPAVIDDSMSTSPTDGPDERQADALLDEPQAVESATPAVGDDDPVLIEEAAADPAPVLPDATSTEPDDDPDPEPVDAPPLDAETEPSPAPAPAPAPAEAEPAPTAPTAEAPAEDQPPPADDPFGGPGDWYVVHTYAGYENKVKTNLESRIHTMQMEDKIFRVHIPMEDVMEIKSGKKQVVQKKVFPGYLLVKMWYDNDSWYVVRNTPGVTGFVSAGTGSKPTPLSKREIEKILVVKKEEVKPQFRLGFEEGDVVRIISGPFADFNGTINEINVDQSKLKVLVNIFDRETPVELGFDQVSKV